MDADTKRRVDERLEELYRRHLHLDEEDVTKYYASGRGYYPPDQTDGEQGLFGVCLVSAEGEVHGACTPATTSSPFALQSISKVFAYGLALDDQGLERVGVKPSGDSFNSIEFDERNNRPHNPMVNAGALVTTDMVEGATDEREARADRGRAALLRRQLEPHGRRGHLRGRARDRRPQPRHRLPHAERRDAGGDVEAILSLYLRQCSVQITCRDLATMAATLASGCVNPITGEQALSRDRIRDVLSVMHTCGMYDFAGEWAYAVGVRAKSGVSGGILAVVPGKMGIGVFSPGLDPYGNSVRGTRVCEEISERLGLHVFASEAEDSLLGRAEPA